MLELDLDLEADLGIDTVKQAEMFAAVREIFDIPRDDDLQLRDFPTLADVIQFVLDRRPVQESATADEIPSPSEATERVATATTIASDMEAAAAILRRVPVSLVRPALEVFTSTSVTLDGDSRVIVMLDRGGVGGALVGRLEKRGVTVLTIEDTPDADTLNKRLASWMAEGPIQGVYWLPALDDEGSLADMDLATWRESLRVRVKLLYTTMRTLYSQIGSPGTFLVSATRLGGRHGYDDDGALAPLGGPVVGFTKTYQRERPGALVKAIDFESSRKTAALADLIIGETLRDAGVVEVGYKNGLRYYVGLEEQPLSGAETGLQFGKETVFVVTGAAGSIVSAITADLAAHSGGTFYLLDLVPKPDPADPDIQRFVSDKDSLKRDLFARIKARGERATPAVVEKELTTLERAHAALTAIQAVEAAGGVAHYYSVNLLNSDAVTEVIEDVKKKVGRIDVLIHAAGLEISHMLPDKNPEEFNLVFDVKSDGWFNLLHAIDDMPLGATVVFSSIAGRFGNAGQVDYSAANDLLCKTSSSFRKTRPETRGLSIDWTAWSSIGMASRGSIPKMMELAGIDMLPPQAGIPMVRRELTLGDGRSEVVVAKSLGVMLDADDKTGNLDLDVVLPEQKGPMAAKVVGFDLYGGLVVESTLDPTDQPFLDHHRIDGTPVLPGVMGVEAFAEAAGLLFPNWYIASVEDVRFLAPFKFYRDDPRTVTVHAGFYSDGEDIVAVCRLTGSRRLPKQSDPVVTTHFTGKVRLTRSPLGELVGYPPSHAEGAIVEKDHIYNVYFHGPTYQVLEKAWRSNDKLVGLRPTDLPENHRPATLKTQIAPRLIEQCFQTAGIAEIGRTGMMGLPEHIDKVSVLRDPGAADSPLLAVVTPDVETGTFDAEVVDEKGVVYVVLRGYATIRLPGNVEEALLMPLQAVMQ